MTTAAWYLFDEWGDPRGYFLKEGDPPVPVIDEEIKGNEGWQRAQVVSFEELAHICAMRRVRVVIRVMEA